MTEQAEIKAKKDNDQFEIFSDTEDTRADENKMAKGIVHQIVTLKRRRTQLQNVLENLYDLMDTTRTNLIELPEQSIDTLLEFMTVVQENRFYKVIY